MSTVTTTSWRAFLSLVRIEFRLNVREPAGLVVGLGMPVLLVVVFGSIPTFQTAQDALGGLSPLDLYGPILMVFTLSMLALNSLPLRLATYRELGFLRRLAVTPVQPSRLLLAQLTVYATVAVAATALILGIGATAYHLRLPGSVPGLIITLVLTAAALFPLGLLIASSAPTAKAAGAHRQHPVLRPGIQLRTLVAPAAHARPAAHRGGEDSHRRGRQSPQRHHRR